MNSPDSEFLSASLQDLRAAEAYACINPHLGMAMANTAASGFELETGTRIYDQLTALGLSEEQMEGLTEDDLRRLVPTTMEQLTSTIATLGAVAQQALNDQVDYTQRYF
jgi:hypothetical protein